MAETLGSRLRAARQRRKWTLKDLAGAAGLSVPYVSDIERDVTANPTLETLQALGTALQIPLGDLLGSAQTLQRPLSVSLQRFVATKDFSDRVRKLAVRAGRSPDDIEGEVIDFLATAPKRSSGGLSFEDWRRLLDFYAVILEE